MFRKKNAANEEQNFWISYADLMAGVLFVFILLIGAIVVKSVLMRHDLEDVRVGLQQESEALRKNKKELADKSSEVEQLQEKLKLSRERKMRLILEIDLLQNRANELNTTVAQLSVDLKKKGSEVTLSQIEINTLKEMLFDADTEMREMLSIIDMLNSDLNSTQNKVSKLHKEMAKADAKHKSDENTIVLKDKELAQLQKALLLKKRDYQRVVEDLNLTRVKIKNLTGIKVKVVQHLKEKLGHNMLIDPRSGALRLSSNILFNQGRSELKPEAKKELRQTLGRYIDTLLKDEDIAPHIDLITIEGHTNSDGTYLYNLVLSQKRALAVMEFLYEQYPDNQLLFQKYLSASGRSYAQPILKQGTEDKEASRRIEIRFLIKNEDAIRELVGYINER